MGPGSLKDRLLEQMAGEAAAHFEGEAVEESAKQKAEQVVREELKRRGWEESESGKGRKTDQEKVAEARRLRRESVMTVGCPGQRLKMGSRHTLAKSLKAQ